MVQTPYARFETFDLGTTAVTYTAAGLGAAKYTAGVLCLARLDDGGAGGALNGFISALWSPGSGTAGTVLFGAYAATGTATAGTLYLLGSTANVGALVAGNIRRQMTNAQGTAVNFQSPGPGNPQGAIYGALLVATDSGTNHVDAATCTAFALAGTNANNADLTGGGQFPRCVSSGTAQAVLPATVAMSGVSATTLLPWLAVD
jgi:hypothetical protein